MENTIVKHGGKFKGHFLMEVFDSRDPLTGKRFRDAGGRFMPRQLISKAECDNIITDQGLNHFLNAVLHGETQISPWYCLLFEDDYTPDGGETYAVPEFTESTAYAEATRPEYVEANSTAKSTTNSANKAVFTANASKTWYGAALVGGGTDASTKGDAAGGGKLLCAGKFGTAQPVISGNVVNLTYTVTSADAG
ncbi:MAG: hypothetical protein WC329_01630 [Candidatus Omnitrophota bacterium]|jgi:hypothetical protein